MNSYAKYKGKSMRPGGGGRFKKMTDQLEREGRTADEAKAIAASAGRKKYGKKRMAEWAKRGRKK